MYEQAIEKDWWEDAGVGGLHQLNVGQGQEFSLHPYQPHLFPYIAVYTFIGITDLVGAVVLDIKMLLPTLTAREYPKRGSKESRRLCNAKI